MLGLPKSTDCNHQLPKKAIYAKFRMDNTEKGKFDAEISRISIVNEVTPATTVLAEGTEIKDFFVLLVTLKRKEYDAKVISQLPRLIEQNLILLLEYSNEGRLAIYHGKLICSPWRSLADCQLQLRGLDLDSVWENLIVQIGNINVKEGNTLTQQIEADTQREKLEKEIERLERLARKEVQPRKKYELVEKIRLLKQR